MILAMIYLERLQIKNSDYLESVSPSGLFVVTMVCIQFIKHSVIPYYFLYNFFSISFFILQLAASKFLFENEDDIVTNQIWSEALNMDVKELNALEQKFLAAIVSTFYVHFNMYYFFPSLHKILNYFHFHVRLRTFQYEY